MWSLALVALLGLVNASPEYVTKKFCKDVDPSQCTIYTAVVDPCDQGPSFCSIKRNKKYVLTLNLSPKFSAKKLKLALSGDIKNNGNFSTILQPPSDGCDNLTCPIQAQERRIFDIDLNLDKRATGKFPVQVKLWNEENESQACCFSFNVKVK